MSPFVQSLGSIPLLSTDQTRSISAENPTGGKGQGAQALPDHPAHPAHDLGQGWKVSPAIALLAGQTTTLAEITGPGTIQRIWMTVEAGAYRDCILRFYWDNEPTPSIEVPLGDFFCCGHGLRTIVSSLPITVAPDGGFNCYWPMPFRTSARITIENQRAHNIGGFFYQITYALGPVPDEAAYLHAQWRQSVTPRSNPIHTIVDNVSGNGHYVGTYIAWVQMNNGSWVEGEVKFYLDGDANFPTIVETGTEDYFGGAWGFSTDAEGREIAYSTPFLGLPLIRKHLEESPKFGLYRWHIMDPVRFQQDLRVTIQALGWWPNGRFQPLNNELASTAYWYQSEPHGPFPGVPPIEERWPR